ncbi:DUF262 domain-containing protein [Candidatus Mycoplasma mahonii]|uniref:DUF262 domain-containing protein n=1 Tax=Candidatus Mycoplasma mahonii TaxID=3004105 RepID=UPI0026F30009|nr:DUF262 domain-containing HNH endonuclease family protein [Candidatus Mycoplasma mahonii]WKX02770.1 DUF262 domain-containing HNH endonuclease family protein [Candidatus Mycoplasma mahonii]
MTNNFKIMFDFTLTEKHLEITQSIGKIESSIFDNKLEHVFLEGRRILELIFSHYYDEIPSLDFVINDYKNKHAISSKVKNALYSIKIKANESAHFVPRKVDEPYIIDDDVFSSIEFLKQIYIVIKHFIMELNDWSERDDDEYEFNSSIYGGLFSDKGTSNVSSEDIMANSDSLTSKTKGIFEIICSEYSFLIPTYQRAYTWTDDNVGIFLQDIKDRVKDKKDHYVGSLALAIDNKNKLMRIIDGQQRITTSLLIIKAIIDRFKKSKILKMPKELDDLSPSLANKYKNTSRQFGEIHFIKKILMGLITDDKPFKNSRAFKNFEIINDFLDKMNDTDVDEFYTTFVYSFVVTELKFNNDVGNEIQIFENLNSKGLDLFQWDLIKNYIYKNIEVKLLINHEDAIDHLLNELFLIPSTSWGKKQFVILQDFFTFYCRIEHKEIHNEALNEKGKIHKIFANVWPRKKTKFESVEQLRKSLLKPARLFTIYCELKSGAYRESNSQLFVFKLPIENTSIKNVHFPLMMNVLYNESIFEGQSIKKINNKEKILLLFEDIEKYIIRLLVVNNVGQSLSFFFDKLISPTLKISHQLFIEGIRIPGKISSLPSFNDYKSELQTKNDWQPSYAIAILKRLEIVSSNNITNKRYQILLKASLEHIMPQKRSMSSTWRTQYGDHFTNQLFNEEYQGSLNKLGNYIILSQSLNSKVKNSDFKIKIDHYKEDGDAKLITGNFTKPLMNLLIKDSFTFEDIENRTKELANLLAPWYKFDFEK